MLVPTADAPRSPPLAAANAAMTALLDGFAPELAAANVELKRVGVPAVRIPESWTPFGETPSHLDGLVKAIVTAVNV